MSTSSSVHLEYGFPSTHSANAVSVSIYTLAYLCCYVWAPLHQWTVSQCLIQGLISLCLLGYGTLVPLSRIYTGMHSLTDVVGGCICGIGIACGFLMVSEPFEAWLNSGLAGEFLWSVLEWLLPLL